MLCSAKALSAEGIKDILRSKTELLHKHSFISILPEDMRKSAADIDWPQNSDRWLSMYFEDIRPEHLLLLPMLEEQLGRRLSRFNEDDADKIIDFLERCQHRPENETLYVNCVAGISRSGAIVSFACEIFEFDRKAFKRANPQILPNNLVLYLLRERWQLRNAMLQKS